MPNLFPWQLFKRRPPAGSITKKTHQNCSDEKTDIVGLDKSAFFDNWYLIFGDIRLYCLAKFDEMFATTMKFCQFDLPCYQMFDETSTCLIQFHFVLAKLFRPVFLFWAQFTMKLDFHQSCICDQNQRSRCLRQVIYDRSLSTGNSPFSRKFSPSAMFNIGKPPLLSAAAKKPHRLPCG